MIGFERIICTMLTAVQSDQHAAIASDPRMKSFFEQFESDAAILKCTFIRDLLLHPYLCNPDVLFQLSSADRAYIGALGSCTRQDDGGMKAKELEQEGSKEEQDAGREELQEW